MTDIDTVTTSNGLRLSAREWLGVGLFTLLVVLAAPSAWNRVEPFEPGPDYRLPFALGNDYRMYDRFARWAAERHDTLLVGDSVVWGHFVTKEQTLSHHLNVLAGGERFANLGLDGSHPAALAGLLEHYGAGLRDKRVVIQCNPTWISSPEPDLRDPNLRKEQTFPFNHAPLLPQFSPAIPCYRADLSARLGAVVDRSVPFNGWTRHLQAAYFDNHSIPEWTLEHPYENPLARFSRGLPPSDDLPEEEPIAWTARGMRKQDLPWVDLETSIQFASFRRAVEILQSRGNQVFVIVGPYNEHALTESSLAKYLPIKAKIVEWLASRKIPHAAPEPLPSAHYADASHPLDAGYALLARRLFENEFFGRGAVPVAAAAPVPDNPGTGPVSTSGASLDMVVLPAGEFTMGGRRISLSSFWIDRTTVTQELFQKVMGSNPSKRKAPQNPVERVQWTAAVRFCNRISELEGLSPCYDLETWTCDFEADGYRLPTEAEWEYACRAGSAGRYSFGDDASQLAKHGWCKPHSGGLPQPVGKKLPNAWGLFDMHGNVWQWCNDWYGEGSDGPSRDPRGPASGTQRVLRGGAADSPAERCTASYRFKEQPAFGEACFGADYYGFRRVRNPAGIRKEKPKTASKDPVPALPPTPAVAAPSAAGKIDPARLKGTIVFVSNRSGNLDLWRMSAAGKDPRPLTSDAHPDADPRFSPDGRAILYTTVRDGSAEVWRMNRDGSDPRKVAVGSQAAWSPDAKSILFIRDNQAWIRELASGAERRVTPEAWERCGVPAWHPDGKSIAVASRHEETIGIFLLDLDGKERRRLKASEPCCTPAFSKDGKRLLFQTTKGRVHQIGVDEKGEEQVTFGGDIQHEGRFSPDGTMFVFARAPAQEGPWQICVTDLQSNDLDFVTLTREGSNSLPDWSEE